jgi:hypothetical protein
VLVLSSARDPTRLELNDCPLVSAMARHTAPGGRHDTVAVTGKELGLQLSADDAEKLAQRLVKAIHHIRTRAR